MLHHLLEINTIICYYIVYNMILHRRRKLSYYLQRIVNLEFYLFRGTFSNKSFDITIAMEQFCYKNSETFVPQKQFLNKFSR